MNKIIDALIRRYRWYVADPLARRPFQNLKSWTLLSLYNISLTIVAPSVAMVMESYHSLGCKRGLSRS